MKFRNILLVYIGLVFLVAPVCASERRLKQIKVNAGDTLHALANKYLQDPGRWPEIHQYNTGLIENPDIILPEMTVNIPLDMVREDFYAAQIIDLRNRVRYRRKKNSDWKGADKNTELVCGDAVRTSGQSYVMLEFETGEMLRVGEKSLVILKPENKEEIHLVTGKIRTDKACVLTSNVLVEPSLFVETDYTAEVKQNNTTQISVIKGYVNVTSEGKKVTVSKGYSVQVKYNEAPSMPVLDHSFTASETQKGETLIESEYFHIQVSKDRFFKEVLVDEELSVSLTNDNFWKQVNQSEWGIKKFNSMDGFLHGLFKSPQMIDIAAGEGYYYWRLFVADTLGLQSSTEAKSFIIDKTPPILEVKDLENGMAVFDEVIAVKGYTETGCAVSVNGKEAVMRDGKFMLYISVQEGINKITIKSKDEAGNENVLVKEVVRL